MTAFNIGDKVRWQCRNMYRSNPRMPSFYMVQGEIASFRPDAKNPGVLLPVAKYAVSYTDQNGNLAKREALQTFRLLKNGKYIAQEEHRDDPKGRLNLKRAAE